MKPQTAATVEWQGIGGTFTIPDGWFVDRVNLDLPEPYANVVNETTGEEREIHIPKALAYFLVTHHCGSEAMREVIASSTRRELQNRIKDALGI